MFNFPVSKEDSKVKVAFPDAVGIIRNVNMNTTHVAFEVVCFGNEEAYEAAKNINNHIDDNAIICRKHFNIEMNDANQIQLDNGISGNSAVDNIFDICEAYAASQV